MTLVALNVDPNEDGSAVADHAERNELAGTFAVPPQAVLDGLVTEFGADFVTPPTAPVILLDADQESARMLRRGVKDADDLRSELP